MGAKESLNFRQENANLSSYATVPILFPGLAKVMVKSYTMSSTVICPITRSAKVTHTFSATDVNTETVYFSSFCNTGDVRLNQYFPLNSAYFLLRMITPECVVH